MFLYMNMKVRFMALTFLAILIVCGCKQAMQESVQKEMYLFSYFKGNGEDGLHLAYSADGKTWEALRNDTAWLCPTVGGKLMRDPSITQDEEGTFHMVWTTGWWDQGIGYASSKDLIHWSEQKSIPVMANFKGTRNTWAPELFYDKKDKNFYIFWASTVPLSDLANSETAPGMHHRQYYVTTKDFITFSETRLYFEPDFSVIDGSILQKGDTYYLFVKNENEAPAEKNIRVTTNMKPYDFPTEVSAPITGDYWAEGPAPLQVGDYVYVYFDKYTQGKYGAIRSLDMKTWEDISDSITFPQGIRHGTAFKVEASVVERLKQDNGKG